MAAARKLLVVNADDLGMCGAVNRGIARCFDAGSVTQASLMMPCPEAAEGARLAAERSLPTAVHLTLACEWDRFRWGPLSGGLSLLAEDGYFLRDVPSVRATADPLEVAAELEAQVEAYLAAGLQPVAFDSHMQLYDEDAMATLVSRYGVRSRDPLPRYAADALPYASVFRMSPLHPELKLHALCSYARSLSSGVHLVVCHPAEDDPELLELYSAESSAWQRAWARSVRLSDLECLLHPAFLDACADGGVELVSADVAFEPAGPDVGKRPARPTLGALPPGGPAVIGATGGSGTRAVARILRLAGLYTGANLNESEDAIDLGGFSDRWINAFTASRDGVLPAALDEVMRDDLAALLERHCAGLERAGPWGWKEPRSSFLLPFFHAHLPALRFLHVVRDGRDMAFSSNQNQLNKHGSTIGLPWPGLDRAAQSIALWNWLNLETADYGEQELGERYLRVRFEDLCREPAAVAARLFDFFELQGDPEAAAREVRPPPSLGSWRAEDCAVVAELERLGGAALVRFGYELTGASKTVATWTP